MIADSDRSSLAFGEKLLSLLDTGSFTTSYKYALLLAMLDAVLENARPDGSAPRVLSGRDLGRRVFALYWTQARPFSASGALRQSAQRDIVVKISELRSRLGLPEQMPLDRAAGHHPTEVAALEAEAVATVIRYPIPLLQRFGGGRTAVEDRFIYEYGWEAEIAASRIERGDFDDRLVLVGEAGEHLTALAGLVRPVVQREWLHHVARRNEDELDDLRVEAFLFGATRVTVTPVRRPLLALQGGSCFYCHGSRGPWEVDHFLPWSRWPDDCLDNLVVAHRSCNNDKRSALASAGHLRRWWPRFTPDNRDHRRLRHIATETGWPRRPDATIGAARALYLHQPEGTMLWSSRGAVEPLRREEIKGILGERWLDAAAEHPSTYPDE